MASDMQLGRLAKKGALVKTEVCVSIVAAPVTGQPPANHSGIVDSKHYDLGAPMQMQCKETHKCRQNKISWVWVMFSKSQAESPETIDCPNSAPRARAQIVVLSYYSSYSCNGSESNLTKCNVRLINHQRVQIRQIILENRYKSKSTKHELLCQISESPPKYFVLGNLGNLDSCLRPRIRHHQSCLGSGTWVREGKGMQWAPPLTRSKDRPLQTWYVVFENTCVLIPIINLTYYVMRTAYKYRLNYLNWNKTIHCLFSIMVWM